MAADLPKPPEKPVGIVVSVQGTVFVDTHLSETAWAAAPGILLFPGYTIRNVKGSVRFSFCPNDSEFTLAPGAAVTLRARQIDGQGLQAAGHPSFCEVPLANPPSNSSARGESPPEEPLTAERGAELSRRLKPVEDALAANFRDVNAQMARIAILQEFGRTKELLTAK